MAYFMDWTYWQVDDTNYKMIPNSLEECYKELDKDGYKHLIRGLSREEIILLHHNLGRELRNKWGLWRDDGFREMYNVEKSPIRELLLQMGFTHPDDMSHVILESYWCKSHGLEYNFTEKAKEYREFWKKEK